MFDKEYLKQEIKNKKEYNSNNNKNSKEEQDLRAFQENMIRGTETMDSSGLIYAKWNGIFFDLFDREMTDEEFIDYIEWSKEYKKKGNELLIQIWLDWIEHRNYDINLIEKFNLQEKIRKNDHYI